MLVLPLLVYAIHIQFIIGGRVTDEKLLRRYEDSLPEEIDSDGRPRRQLPTEINIQVTAPLFTARLYDYGAADGDKQVPPSVDVGMRLELTHPVTFFGQKYNEVYVLSNGGIGFEQNSRNYKSNILKTGPTMIAPLWNRNDLRKGGQIFYREVTEGRPIERAQSEVRYQYDKNIKPISVILVTWVNMQPNGDQTVNTDNANTVQAAIISTENATYANLIYKNIGWSQGAEAGFSKGDGQSFYSMPSSGTDNIMYLKDYGNTGIPGEWIFEIGQKKIIRCKSGIKGDTCDDECAEFEWGPDCDSCCHCAKGRCNVLTGECNGNECKHCWSGSPSCNKREPDCKSKQKDCGFNALSLTDYDHCGEIVVRCQCLSGYSGDGFNCTDVDECSKKHPCHEHATCTNTPGRYYCECKAGFSGNGTACTEIEVEEQSTARPSTISLKSRTHKSDIHPSPAFTISPTQHPLPIATTERPVLSTKERSTIFSSEKSSSPEPQPTTSSSSTNLSDFTNVTLHQVSVATHEFTTEPSSKEFTTESSVTNVTHLKTETNASESNGTVSTLGFTIQSGITLIAQPFSTPPLFPLFENGSTPTSSANHTEITSTPPTKSTLRPKQYPEDLPKVLPKETNAHMVYQMKQPLMILGKQRHKLTVWSTGVVALDDVAPLNPDSDLEAAKIQGFAPFFGKIDLSRGDGKVFVGETSDFEILADATNMVEQHFHAPGFSAKSVVSITFENVSSPNGQSPNTFEVVLVGGVNAAGENVTYVEYVYNDLQWSDDARAMVLSDVVSNSVVLPGSGSDNVKRLAKQSNIKMPGEWMFRVDLPKINPCPFGNLLPPFCETELSLAPGTQTTGPDPSLLSSAKPRFSHPSIDFEDNGQTVTFPAFITLVPQLITPNLAGHPLNRGQTVSQLVTPAPRSFISVTNPSTPVSSLTNYFSTRPSSSVVNTTPIPIVQNVVTSAEPEVFVTHSIVFPNTTIPSTLFQSSYTSVTFPNSTPSLSINQTQPEHVTTVGVHTDWASSLNSLSVHETVSQSRELLSTSEADNGSQSSPNLPPLQIFTSSSRKSTRLPVPTKTTQKIVTAGTGNNPNLLGEDAKKAGPPYNIGSADEQDSLNSPSKLAIIIPTAIVGVWLLLLVIIGVVVCCRRRKTRKRMRSKYDPAYHFRHASHAPPISRGKDGGLAAVPPANGYPHVSYEDHLDKAARLADMTQYGGQNGRAAMYGSYWNLPSSSRQQYNYYNQGYYDSCPEFSRYNYNGRY